MTNTDTKTVIKRVLFSLGLTLFVLGWIISFVPGTEVFWFEMSAAFLSAGLLIPKRLYQIASIVCLLLSALQIYNGRQRGIQYRQYLEQLKQDSKTRPADR